MSQNWSNDMRKQQQGFTLVEIAIVLVIIGLLLGGILKGQEMITQAKIKNVVADFSGVSAAYYGYLDRYRAIPGDDLRATRWTGAVAGDGNSVVEGKYNTTVDTDESRKWWDHLRRAGFVGGAGSGYTQPLNALVGMIGVETGDGLSPTGPALGGFSGLIMCSANLPDKIAIAVDSQMDDGIVSSGGVRGQLQTTANPDISATAASAYAETGTNVYVICRQI
jgi:prepilin-type N-terminal cleavage/methylation domain-containing protein